MRNQKQNDRLASAAELSNEPIDSTRHNLSVINYLNIPFIVFLLLSLLTGGLYRVYWLYRNWKAIKKADKSDISPFWRAIFAIFFINEFFQHVCESAKELGYKGFVKHRLLDGWYVTFVVLTWVWPLLFIVFSGISAIILHDNSVSSSFMFVGVLLYFLPALCGILKYVCLWPIQRAINFYKDQVEQEHLSTIANGISPVIGYFDVSPTRFLIFNILTLRLYALYWSYKNWQAIKRAKKRNIIPFWRSIFSIFFIYGLFRQIYFSAKDLGFPKRIPYWQLAVGYIFFLYFLLFLGRLVGLPARMSETWYYVLVLGVGVTFDFLFFRPMQEAIRFYNTKAILNYKPRKGIIHGEIILLIIGGFFYISLFRGGLDDTSKESSISSSFKSFSSKLTAESMAWKTFQPSSKAFKVKFPTTPTHEEEEISMDDEGLTAHYENYESISSSGTEYSVTCITYPSEIQLDEIEPREFVDDMVATSSGNKLISSENTYVGKHRAVDFLIKSKFSYMKDRIILVGQTKYLLMVSYLKGTYDKKDYRRFINSFSLKSEN